MDKITILDEKFDDLNEYTLARAQILPKGYLYNPTTTTNIFKILKSFSAEYQAIYLAVQKQINDFYFIDESSEWLDEWLATYGLPNVIFPELNTAKDKVRAINVMRYVNKLNDVASYKAFFALLGYNVKFYHANDFAWYFGIPMSIPMGIGTNPPKNKITYWVSVQEGNQAIDGFDIPMRIPMYIYSKTNNINIVKKILDFIKPDYILLRYLTDKEKKQFNL
jgi:hypothetical protein